MKKFANTQLLNGLWDFAFFHRELDDREVLAAECNELAAVPGCFDAANELYGKHGTGIYRTKVNCSGRIMLTFKAIGLRARVFFDDCKAGDIPWAFNPASFVIEAGSKTEHTLTVAVENTFDPADDSMFHPFYDFYAFGGIYRSVEMRQLPEVWITNSKVSVVEMENGTVDVSIQLSGGKDVPTEIFIDGEKCASVNVSGQTVCRCRVPFPAPWSPESPVMHSLKVVIPGDSLESAFGLRQLEWQNGTLKLNGKELKLLGFCRHDSHPEGGYAISEDRVLKDLQMLKNQGCNFLRGSHYKQSEFLLDCCDRMGILVWEESCAWGNTKEQCSSASFISKQVEQTKLMIEESFNHPCIIMWGFMNELCSEIPEGRPILEALFKAVREADPSRPVTFATKSPEEDLCLDLPDIISTNVYPGWYMPQPSFDDSDTVMPFLTKLEDKFSHPEFAGKPWIISEIGAAALPGEHSGGRWSEDYQEKIIREALSFTTASARCSGIAIWLFANANTYFETTAIMSRPRGFNNKGLLTEHRIPKMAWRTVKEFCKK